MKHLKIFFQVFISILLLVISIGPMASQGNSVQSKVNPLLVNLARKNPSQLVSVIVQQNSDIEDFNQKVARFKGEITGDLSIIKAVTVNLPAGAALTMAADPHVRWVSLDAPVENTKRKTIESGVDGESNPVNYFLDTLGVHQIWETGIQGQGIAVAVIDSGTNLEKDLQVNPAKAKPDSRVLEQLTFNSNAGQSNDATGHGTHVAGIIGGSGYNSGGLYAGIAPQVNFISLKISDGTGMAYESDVIEAMQWVLENKERYNIRVVNLSINSTQESSYHESPLDAAAEILWFNEIVVVASAGNKGQGGGYNTTNAAPANDPFIISVGASDENATPDPLDDTIATFSSHSTTMDGFRKPEIIAPGTDIVSILGPGNWISEYPDRVVMNGEYFRLSGTSMSAPMVTGAVALLLQDEPELTPDQVKFRLLETARLIGGNFPYLDVYAAVTGTTNESANTGTLASQLLWSGDNPVAWESVAWNSVAWNSVAWNSVAWNSVAWNSVAWNSVFFGD